MAMDSACVKCQNCDHYSYMMVGGGLDKIERCRKQHKEGKEDCPDYKEFVFDCDSYIYYKGRVER